MSLQPALPAAAQASVRPEYVFSESVRETRGHWCYRLEEVSAVGALEVYLVRYPGVRIDYAIQDHMPGALRKLNIYRLALGQDQTYLGEHWGDI